MDELAKNNEKSTNLTQEQRDFVKHLQSYLDDIVESDGVYDNQLKTDTTIVPQEEEKKEYIIPVRFVGRGYVFVQATSRDDAMDQFDAGNWSSEDIHETYDWQLDGEPELND